MAMAIGPSSRECGPEVGAIQTPPEPVPRNENRERARKREIARFDLELETVCFP